MLPPSGKCMFVACAHDCQDDIAIALPETSSAAFLVDLASALATRER